MIIFPILNDEQRVATFGEGGEHQADRNPLKMTYYLLPI